MGNGKAFVWTPAKREALELCTDLGVSQREIAERVGVTLRTVEGWVRRPAFQSALEARYAEIRAQNEAYWARKRAERERLEREHIQRLREQLQTLDEKTKVWLAWNMACHQARAAHRKLPAEPPGLS